MTKKIVFILLAIIGLCLCCGYAFAVEDNNVTLGNEIMKSIDKTGDSMENVVSGNVIQDAGETVRNGMDDIGTGMENGAKKTTNYVTTQTTTEGTAERTGMTNTMSTTTWMWIILVVASIIIVAAIWYYATNNG